MKLPEKKSVPLEKIEDYLILVYGQPKIGKSTFCASMPDPIFIATEAGLNSLEVYQLPVTNWAEFLEACGEVKSSDRFSTVVVDTIDNAYQYCLEHVCKREGFPYPREENFGKDWFLITQEFKRVIGKLSQGPRGVVLVSHSQDVTLKTSTSEITKAVPAITGKAREFLLGLADVILYAEIITNKKGSSRVLHSAPSENWEAGDRTGRLPEVMPLNWEAVVKAFGGTE